MRGFDSDSAEVGTVAPPRSSDVPATAAVSRLLLADQRVRYLLAGVVGAVLYYLLFSLGWLALGASIPYLAIATVTSTACAALTYPLYRNVVFRTAGPWLPGFWRFYVVCLWSLGANLGLLSLLVELVGLHVLLSQAVVVVVGPLVNYQVSRLWAFRRPADARAPQPARPVSRQRARPVSRQRARPVSRRRPGPADRG